MPASSGTASTVRAATPVVVFDGECPYCRKQVRRIQAWAAPGAFEYVARQTPGIEERFPRLRESTFSSGMRLIEPDGAIHVGADAVYQIARRLNGWRYLAWFYRIPGLRGLCRAAYGWIAANRYRLARDCDTGVCER
jgi:predicted DCC family thiol-disulfide oxidoreductase YuxK